MGILGSILKGIPGVGTVVQGLELGAGVLGAIKGAKSGAKADKLNSRALQLADDRYAAGAPFRSKLAETAFNIPTQREDLSSIFADPGNPWSRTAPRPVAPQPMNTATPQAPIPAPRGGLAAFLNPQTNPLMGRLNEQNAVRRQLPPGFLR